MITEKQPMDPAYIKAELQIKGCTQQEIAGLLCVSRTLVTQVIYGRVTSRRVAAKIAEIIHKDINDIWPGRYKDEKMA